MCFAPNAGRWPAIVALSLYIGLHGHPAFAQVASGDFDGDGFADLAVAATSEDVGAIADAGAVHVIYGTSTGLNSSGADFWHQNKSGILDSVEAGDGFGMALAAGDFDGDGRDDLAIGIPLETISGVSAAGAVAVLYGTSSGLAASGNQFWHQNSSGIAESAQISDEFGFSLATGDFNNDGFIDLAIGVPFESVGSVNSAGAVHILYGSASGLRSTGSQFWSQNTSGIADSAEIADFFGWSLASGDFNGDHFTDLAIGIPFENISGAMDTGAVCVLYGSGTGLRASGNQIWHQNSTNINDACEDGDLFGYSLAAGDFDNDGRSDLAVGVRHEAIGGATAAGAVNVIYGSGSGLTASADQFWHQNSNGIADVAEENDLFSDALAAGDFNGDGFDDLAIGIPSEDVGAVLNAGAVAVLYGSASNLVAAGSQLWTQDSTSIMDVVEADDNFGMHLASGRFRSGARHGLAIGVPMEDLNAVTDAGVVNLLYGSSGGLTGSGDQIWSQESTGINDTAEAFDKFG